MGTRNDLRKQIASTYDYIIDTDPEPLDPRKEADHLGTMVTGHRRYNLGDRYNATPEEERYLKRHGAVLLPLYLIDHSGLTILTTPFSCSWDSGQVGYIYVTREYIREEYGKKRVSRYLREKVTEVLKAEVEEYNAYLRGEVYYWTLRRNEDPVDSCYGYYSREACEEGAKDALEGWINSDLKTQVEKQIELPFEEDK